MSNKPAEIRDEAFHIKTHREDPAVSEVLQVCGHKVLTRFKCRHERLNLGWRSTSDPPELSQRFTTDQCFIMKCESQRAAAEVRGRQREKNKT